VISLKLAPSASSTAQITRNLQSIRADLTKLEAQADSVKAGKGKGKAGKESELEKGVREAGDRYDRLVEMLEEDDSGKERAKALKREKV
jgi:syntaxin 8